MMAPLAPVPPPGPHGGDGWRLARALGLDPASITDLSHTLNPWAPHITELARQYLDALRRYPDAEAQAAATAELAERLEVAPEQVLLTNGGAEAIALAAAVVGGGVVAEPEFSLHPRGDGPRWRSNPASPLGHLAGPDERAGVWDESFFGLATGAWTRGDLDRGAVVVGSLTKVFACPGLRLGYLAAADAVVVEAARRTQAEWAVNGLALAVLPALLEGADLPAWAAAISAARADLVDVLHAHDLEVTAADAPWVLVRRAGGLRERLANVGVVVRDCTSFGLDATVRIAVPDEAGLAHLATALGQVC
jgi:histidinol-phosphate/aromatic aminotransferase/cobyric acid decarboxylase-like protein